MTTSKLLATAGILLAFVSLSFIPAAAQSYNVTDLGTLGGKTSGAVAINDKGQVAGVADTASGFSHAFFWSDSTGMLDLGVLGSDYLESVAGGINNAGDVVGWSYGNGSVWGGFLWSKRDGMNDIGSLGCGITYAYAINDFQQVVGTSCISTTATQHAFLWSRTGGMQDLGTLGGDYSYALAVNNSGEVVGYAYLADNVTPHAFLWTQSGGMQDLGTLGGSDSFAFGINASGQVTGSSFNSSETLLGFLWTSAHGMAALGAKKDTTGLSINALGQIVGLSEDDQLGFLWTKAHRYQNLNGLMPHTFGLIEDAIAINKTGQIVGHSDKVHALLLTPAK